MSLIFGVFYRDGRVVEQAELDRMAEVLSYPQIDAKGIWRQGSVGLGHLAHWTTPEASSESCPYRHPPTGIIVTADARIDNRDELKTAFRLSAEGRPIGDAELIACAYLRWGCDCAAHLIGDFAFALWDPSEARLFCARDTIGFRPFFYHWDGSRFIFGSEIKTIFTHSNVPRDWDARCFALRLSGIPSFDGITSFRAVRLLEPASALRIDATAMRTWKYWRLEMDREIRFSRDEDYVDAFEELLQRAVNARLRSPRRVGAMLSGGLDATTLLALAMKGGSIPRDRLSAFSWALREGDDWNDPDERVYIEAFLRERPLNHCYIISELDSLYDVPAEIRRHRDGPVWEVEYAQMRPTLAAARERGVAVLLSGTGGDETASPPAPDHIVSALVTADWDALTAEVTARANFWHTSKSQVWKSHILRPLLTKRRLEMPFHYQWLYRRRCMRLEDLSMLGLSIPSESLRTTDLLEYVREGLRPRLDRPWRSPLRAQQIYELTQLYTQSDLIGSWNYALSYGIECRCPYLDRRVIEFCVAMPPNQHSYANTPRRLLRRVSARYLPEQIAQRRNKSTTMPDLPRGICRRERDLRLWLAKWRDDARFSRFLDVGRLEASLCEVVASTQESSVEWSPSLPFSRGVLLGKFLESELSSNFTT